MTEPLKMPDVPTMRLAGKDWPVPELGPRFLRKARASVIAVNDAVVRSSPDDAPLPEDATEAQREYSRRMTDRYVSLSNSTGDLMYDCIFWAVKFLHREITEEEFGSWPITDDEAFNAWLVVRQQSGLYGRYGKAVSPGEVKAAMDESRSATPTGTT